MGVRNNCGVPEAIAEQWRDWRWENWDDQMLKVLTEADPGPPAGLTKAFQSLAESFEQHQLLDAGTEASAALLNMTGWLQDLTRTTNQPLTTIEDNTFTHRPIDLTSTELDNTRAAIATAAMRAQA
ncbi:hypothetical protein [Nocardia sp. NPDC057030]|uniref:hypothetical protein n=1 Tax=unclassified Nocardia TaxID=2637762 RepID=UPI00362AB07D